ncbi:MAG: hypothetical protein QOF56_3856, partial [Acidobacteriaceae bacterium]|nr:hypothetical protein [Acidobacteriaceae bacterium]
MSTQCSAPTRSGEPEWDLVLATSLADPQESDLVRMRALLERRVDWAAVLRLADDHGTSSLVHHSLSRLDDMVPSSAMAALRERHERNIRKSLVLARELIRILDCLDALGIKAIPYKGLVLSEVYYGDMALRQFGDIDLFVRRSDVTRIKKAVCQLGY